MFTKDDYHHFLNDVKQVCHNEKMFEKHYSIAFGDSVYNTRVCYKLKFDDSNELIITFNIRGLTDDYDPDDRSFYPRDIDIEIEMNAFDFMDHITNNKFENVLSDLFKEKKKKSDKFVEYLNTKFEVVITHVPESEGSGVYLEIPKLGRRCFVYAERDMEEARRKLEFLKFEIIRDLVDKGIDIK